MSDKPDYYTTLGVQRNASQDEIKKAYRRLAMKYHPDRNPDDQSAEDKFKSVKEAYEILSDDQKRAAYDQFGHAGVDPSAGHGGFGGDGAGFGDIFEDIFGDIFGGARGPGGGAHAARGHDLQYNLQLTLEQAVKGESVNIRVPTFIVCKTCEGSGAAPGSKPVSCSTCGGVGQVQHRQGFFTIQQTCPDCHGQGQMISKPCTACHGQGRVQEHKTLAVKVPAGVDTGDRIRLAGEGEAGMHGAPAGDLYVQIAIKPHPIFERDADNLYCEIPINFTTAVLGGEIEVPTLSGRVNLKIPTETQSGKVFRLRGKGVKAVRGRGIGDLFCKVVAETPIKLSREQKDILKQFQDSLNKDGKKHNPKTNSWFAGVRKFFEEMKF